MHTGIIAVFLCVYLDFASLEVNLSQFSKGVQRISDGTGYLLLAPTRFLSGTSNRICLSRFGEATRGLATAQIDLLPLISLPPTATTANNMTSNGDMNYLRQRSISKSKKNFPTGNGGCFDLMVPRTAHTKVWLHLRIRFADIPHYMANTRKKVNIQHGSIMAVVHTDKPVYRSGEVVKFRVLLLKADLTPLQVPIRCIFIEAPSDLFGGPVKVMQWSNVSTQMGLIQMDYTLDKYALKGEWKISVMSGHGAEIDVSQSFQVTEYDLPKFYITTLYQRNIVLSYKQIIWTVCARYMYGEAVKGKLHVKVFSDSYEGKPVTKTVELTGSKGCHNYTARTKTLGFGASSPNEPPTLVISEFAVQEEGTKTWRNSTAIIKVTKRPVNIEFISKNELHIRPGLPYRIKVRVTDWNNGGVETAKLKLCKRIMLTDDEDISNGTDSHSLDGDPEEQCEFGLTDFKGYWQVVSVLAATVTEPFIKFRVTIESHPFKEYILPEEVNTPITATKYMKIWASASLVHMDIGSMQISVAGLRPGSRHVFPLYLSFGRRQVLKAITMHYALVTRGGLLFRWGSASLCPGSAQDTNVRPSINTSPNTICYDEWTFPDNGIFKVNLPLKISHQMCPHSYVITYFMHEGEMIVASKYFKVSDCFNHKIMQRWIPDVVSPSTEVSLRIQSPGPALCAISVSDIALKHVSAHLPIQTHIIQQLKQFVETRNNITAYGLSKDICFKDTSSLRPVNSKTHEFYRNTIAAYRISGLEILSDLLPNTADCPGPDDYAVPDDDTPAQFTSGNSLNYAPKERSYFPETWLWDLQLMQSNGTLEIRTPVPDAVTRYESQVFCVSRSGVAVVHPSHSNILKVFQPFFAHLDMPRKAKMGDHVEVICKVFNYLESTLPVSVSISTPPELAVVEQLLDAISCIPPGQSVDYRVVFRPRVTGSFNVSLSAQVEVNNLYQCPISDNNVIMDTINNVRDTIIKSITILPEGRKVETFKSALLCADDLVKETGISWTFNEIGAVKNSEHWIISVVGDIIGPISLGAEKLLSLPVGCGEQNMAMLYSNLVALNYMQSSGHLTPTNREIALRNLMIGYQRQLRFRLTDGSFSAFGPRDGSGSTWLTAFTLRGLSALKQNWAIGWDERVLRDAMEWLLETQLENGCFQNEGQIFHREMKGGLHSETASIALASFVLISLTDANTPGLKPAVLENAAYCLAALKQRYGKHKNDPSMDVTYTFALATLAQIKIEQYENKSTHGDEFIQDSEESSAPNFYIEFPVRNQSHADISENQFIFTGGNGNRKSRRRPATSPRTPAKFSGGGNNALKILRSMAIRSGDAVWWEAGSLAVSIETTAYAVLSLLAIGGDENWIDALGAVRWLSKYRNKNGGFVSTQDTLVALEAIHTLTKVIPQMPPHMFVTVETQGSGRDFNISPQDRYLLHTAVITNVYRDHNDEAKLKVKANGTGCVLVQITQHYNTLENEQTTSPFFLSSKITTDGPFNCKPNHTWCKCAAILEICVSWNSPNRDDFPEMAVLEIDMPSGYAPDRTLLYELIKKENILLRRIEENVDTSRIYMYLGVGSVSSNIQPNECYNLYLVGPKVSTSPSLIFLYDYYHTDINASQTFTINEACPYDGNRRPHEEPMDLISSGSLLSDQYHLNIIDDDRFRDWHIVNDDADLNVPTELEGNRPVYELPPDDFIWVEHEDTTHGHGNNPNWTNVDFDLDFPDDPEGVKAVSVLPPPPTNRTETRHRYFGN